MNNEELKMVHDYLVAAEYSSIEEWMYDSDYHRTDLGWKNEDGQVVNAWETIVNAIYSSLEA